MEGVTTLITLTQRLPCPGRAPLPVGVGPSSYLDPPPFDVRSVDHEDVLSEREGQIEVAQPGEVQLNTFSKEGRGRPEIKGSMPIGTWERRFPAIPGIKQVNDKQRNSTYDAEHSLCSVFCSSDSCHCFSQPVMSPGA